MADSNPEGTVAAEERTARMLGLLESDEITQEEPAEEVEQDEFDTDDELEVEDDASEESADEDDGQDDDTNAKPTTEDGMRLADYTRKTQELARERQAFQEQVAAVQNERQMYAQYLGQLAQATKPQRPDFEAIANEHGTEAAMRAKIRYEDAMEQYQSLTAEQQAAQQKFQQQAAEQHRAWLRQEQEALFNAKPEWKDPEAYQKASREIEDFAVGLGYTPDQLAQVSHRDILVLDAARQWFAASDKAKKVKPTQGTVLRPGARGQTAGKSRAKKARERFTSSGSVEDAADVLRAIKQGSG